MVAALDTPMTELEAVNLILWAIGQSGVASLTSADTTPDGEAALLELRNTSREFQSRGWTFNTEEDWPLDPDTDGTLTLPRSTLKVRSVAGDRSRRLIVRGDKLYDKVGHTYTIGETVLVEIVLRLDFEDLPASARWLVAVRAARRFAGKRLASSSAVKLTQQDEHDALVGFEQDEAENDNRTLAEASPHMARMKRK